MRRLPRPWCSSAVDAEMSRGELRNFPDSVEVAVDVVEVRPGSKGGGGDDQVGGGDGDAAAAQVEAELAGEVEVGRAEVQVVEGFEVRREEAPLGR